MLQEPDEMIHLRHVVKRGLLATGALEPDAERQARRIIHEGVRSVLVTSLEFGGFDLPDVTKQLGAAQDTTIGGFQRPDDMVTAFCLGMVAAMLEAPDV